MRKHNRWSDNDHSWGPFTVALGSRHHSWAVILMSGDDEDPGCRLRMSVYGNTVLIDVPNIIRPYREKVMATSWDEQTIRRMGRNWYWHVDEKEYGFSVYDGLLQVFLGRQTFDSSTTKSCSYLLPWTQWRHVRRSLYGVKGEHVWTEPEVNWRLLTREQDREIRQCISNTEEQCPTISFVFEDFDGDRLTAKTRIEEREWQFGTGWFKWMSLFRKPKIRRSLDIQFSGETGKRKGSWKGGTIGHSIDMLPGELHEWAFRRYCAEHAMTFIDIM